MFELMGQMIRLPFTTLAYVLEMAAEMASGAGRVTDEGLDRVLGRGGGVAPPAPPAAAPRPAGSATGAQDRPGGRSSGDDGSTVPATARVGGAAEMQATPKEEKPMSDMNLSDDSIKLVHYVIVSIDRDHERILKGGEGYKLVTDNMSADGFTSWIIAHYFQKDDHEKLSKNEKKYLRVCHRVLCRWPREPLHYEKKQLDRLDAIERAIREEDRSERDVRRIEAEQRREEEDHD